MTPEEKKIEESVFAEYSPEKVRTHLEYLTSLERMGGTEGELKAARYIKNRLDEYGIDNQIHEFEAFLSYPQESSLEVVSPVPRSIPCAPRIFIAPTPPGGIEAELVSLGKGSEEMFQAIDVQGKISLIPGDRLGRLHASPLARERGAVAQIHVTPAKARVINYGSIRYTWGNPNFSNFNQEPETIAVSICSEDAAYLETLLQEGPVVVRIKAQAWSGYATIRIPTGNIPGMKEPEKFVLFGLHYCSWFSGATDNAVADSLLLEMARIFSQHRNHLGRSIRFAWWSGHEQGNFAGSSCYLDHFWDDIRDNAIAYFVMDGIGRAGSSGFEPRSTEEMMHFRERVAKDVLSINTKNSRPPKGGDQSFWKMGLPSCIGRTWFTPEQIAAMDGDPVWYSHTVADTMDKVELEAIVSIFKVNAASVLRLCNNPVLPFNYLPVAEMFSQALGDWQKAAKSNIGLDSLIGQAELLKRNVVAFNMAIAETLSAYEAKPRNRDYEPTLNTINTCLMKLGRILMPILSATASQYEHDPIGTRFRPLPTLKLLTRLVDQERHSMEYNALRTSLIRERNRISDALCLANHALSQHCLEFEKEMHR